MKTLKKTLKYLVATLVLLVAALYLTNTDYLIKAVRTTYMNGHTTAYLKDYKEFDNQPISPSSKPILWPNHKNYNSVEPTKKLNDLHNKTGSIAFVIIKNDSIWYENYYDQFNESSKSNSFSMAKSYTSGLMQKAIQDGYIKSLDQPICDFLPQFCEGLAAKTTVGDLSSMSSGTNWDEAYYSPLSITTRAYFDDNLTKVINGLEVVEEPGQKFKYASGDTQMLAMVIEKASGKKMYDYLEECFWKPLGAEHEAFWQVDSDHNDLVKAYCCIASNAKDFARYGKLFKDHGKWGEHQILDSSFVVKSVKPRFSNSPEYGYGWWLASAANKDVFYMRGHLGQYVIVSPKDNVIIVRLGHRIAKSTDADPHSSDFYTIVEEAFKMLDGKS